MELDECFIGGKEGNKHEHKKLKAGRGSVGKIAVLGMRERGTGRGVDGMKTGEEIVTCAGNPRPHIRGYYCIDPKDLTGLIADVVLAYRPKSKQPKPRKRKKGRKKNVRRRAG